MIQATKATLIKYSREYFKFSQEPITELNGVKFNSEEIANELENNSEIGEALFEKLKKGISDMEKSMYGM